MQKEREPRNEGMNRYPTHYSKEGSIVDKSDGRFWAHRFLQWSKLVLPAVNASSAIGVRHLWEDVLFLHLILNNVADSKLWRQSPILCFPFCKSYNLYDVGLNDCYWCNNVSPNVNHVRRWSGYTLAPSAHNIEKLQLSPSHIMANTWSPMSCGLRRHILVRLACSCLPTPLTKTYACGTFHKEFKLTSRHTTQASAHHWQRSESRHLLRLLGQHIDKESFRHAASAIVWPFRQQLGCAKHIFHFLLPTLLSHR